MRRLAINLKMGGCLGVSREARRVTRQNWGARRVDCDRAGRAGGEDLGGDAAGGGRVAAAGEGAVAGRAAVAREVDNRAAVAGDGVVARVEDLNRQRPRRPSGEVRPGASGVAVWRRAL